MINDGGNTMGWNARYQLSTWSGATSASFKYDAFGRRQQKTIAGVTTASLYDGLNAVQEYQGTTLVGAMLTGLGIDEYYFKADNIGHHYFVPDGLGSTVALTDQAGYLQTSYSYEPYGNTTVTGQANTNAYQYTGRENDLPGLYYYRGRYYRPTIGRFMSEDPIGLAGGINLYAYVGGDPINYTDPLGLRNFSQGTMYRGTGDIQGQIWIGNQMRNGAIQNYSTIQRRAQAAWGDNQLHLPNNEPWCRTVCPDEGDRCTPPPTNGIPLVLKPGCYQVCTSGPFIRAP